MFELDSSSNWATFNEAVCSNNVTIHQWDITAPGNPAVALAHDKILITKPVSDEAKWFVRILLLFASESPKRKTEKMMKENY